MKLFSALMQFLIRRIDYLNRAIYTVVVGIIAELAAISERDGIIELASELKNLPNLPSWKYWAIRIFEAILVGGNWLVFGILATLLVGLFLLKYKSRALPQGKHIFNSRLRSIEEFIREFKTSTSLKLLDKLLIDIDDSYILENEKIAIKAKAEYLVGLCRVQNGTPSRSTLSHIESYLLVPGNISYKERACVSYFHAGKKDLALQLAKELLIERPLNERANAIKLALDKSFNLVGVPLVIRDNPTFKRIYAYLLFANEEDSNALSLFESELKIRAFPNEINYDNIDYWELVGRIAYHWGMQKQPNTSLKRRDDYNQNELIIYGNRVLAKVLLSIQSTELYDTSVQFKLTFFYKSLTDYLLTGNVSAVEDMLDLFLNHLIKEDISNQVATELMICLNQLERFADILKVIDRLDRGTDPQLYLLEFSAYGGLKKQNEALLSFQKYLAGTLLIKDLELSNIILFCDFLITEKLDVSNLYMECIEPKSFDSDFDKLFARCYAYRYLLDKRPEIESSVSKLIDGYQLRSLNTKYCVLIILKAIGKLEDCNNLIETYHDWRREELPMLLLTDNLIELRKNVKTLLEVLLFRRENEPEERLYLFELRIHLLSENNAQVQEVSRLGMTRYPSNLNFEFYHIYSLYKAKDSTALDAVIGNRLLDKPFDSRQKFVLARICFF